MNDDSMVKIMQALNLDYSKAVLSTMQFGQSIENLNKQLAGMKANAMQSAKDINTVFSSQLGQLAGSKTIVDQFGKPFKTIKEEAKAASVSVKSMAKEIKQSNLEQMKAQAAAIQQRVTTKGLSEEYSKQAGLLREQLSVLLTKLQAEGKLSAEEIKRTQQLKEQLDILRAQTRTDTSDKIRENPDWFGEEMQRRVSWFLTGSMFYGAINAAKETTETIKEVEMGMVELARVMTDSTFVFEEYRDSLFKLGIEYGQTFDNVQQIALRWAQSGYNVADSLELTKTSLLALNTAELDAKQATEAMIGIMAQWQLQAEDMALVMDKINITADRHSVTSQDLVDGLLRSSGAARIMNLSMEETIGLLTVMREASGRTGQEVGNALNSILSYIQRPRSIDMLESLGINMFTDEAKTKFRNVLDIFKDIAANWNTLSQEIQDGFVQSADDAELFNEELANALGMQEEWNDLQQRDISQAAAGVYRRNYFIGMIERLANVQGVLNNMIDAEGYSMRENAQTMESLEKKQESLKASMEALAVAAGDAGLGGSLKALASGGTTALNTINKMPKEMKDLVMAFTSTFIAVKTLEMGMKTFGIQLPGISQMIGSLTSGTWSLTAALKSGGTGLTTFAKANAPLLALSAAVGIIVALKNAWKKHREEQEKAIEVSKENIKTLEEEKQGLIELSREYETLKAKEKNLTATADEKERLRDIQRELVELYGVSISGIDAEGQAYADSTNAIQDRIKALEELKAIEQERLETAVMGRDVEDVRELEKNLKKRVQLEKDILEVQNQIDEYVNTLLNKGTLTVSSQYGSGVIDASTEHGAQVLRDYIGNLSREKTSLETALKDVNTTIEEGTQDRQQLLKEDATTIIKQLADNGVKISDEARAYATELSKALSQAPKDIFTLRDELETAIKEFTSSDFTEWSEKYKKALSEGDTKGIDKASESIMGLVRNFAEGNPLLDNFVIAMESVYPTTLQMANAAEKAGKQTIDLAVAMRQMGATAKIAIDELKILNQAIYDVRNGQSLSADTILELTEKYNIATDAIHKTADGYTIEIEALENLREAKITMSMDGINAEIRLAESVKDQVASRLRNYGLEIEQIKNLADARRMLAGQSPTTARDRVNVERMEAVGYDVALKEAYDEYVSEAMKEVSIYQQTVDDLEELQKRAELLEGLLISGGSGSGKGGSRGAGTSKKDQRQFLDSIDAEIRAIKNKNDNLEKTSNLLKEQLNLANSIEGLEGLNEQHRITGRIIANNQELIKSYRKEQDELHKKANDLRVANKKYDIDSWFDSNAERTITYINQYNKATKDQQAEMDKIFNQMQKIKQAWMESDKEAKNLLNTAKDLGIELDNIAIKQEEIARKKLRELIEAEKRNTYLDLEMRQRRANERLKIARQEMEDEVEYYQSKIDRIQNEIDRIQESERARQERLERTKRLDEISKLEDRYHALQYKNIGDLTKEEAKSLELEQERTRYLERQAKIQELLIKLENTRREKNIQQLVKDKDGEWQFEYVADQKEIDDINKQIEDLQKEHSESLTDLKEKTLEDLKKAQEDYDEWERQNDIRRQIESKQRRIKQYQDEIKDLQDKYSKLEKITNDAFEREKENLDRFYTDIDLLTDEKMEELYETFEGNWSSIHGMLTGYFRSIASEYEALIATLSQPLPDPGGSSGDYGYYEESDGGTSFIHGSPKASKTDWSAMYMDARDKGDWRTMEHANRQANIERGLGDIVTSDRDIESIKRKYGYASGGEITKTGWHWIDGEVGKPERVLSIQQTKDFNKFVTYIPDLLKSMQTTHDITANIQIPNLNRSQPIQTVYNHPNSGDTIYYINELTVPTDDFNKFIKDFTNAVDNHPNKTIMKVKKIGKI